MTQTQPTFWQRGRRDNFLRKLQSLCGVVPLGVFLCFHMLVNYGVVFSHEGYDAVGHFLATMPYKMALETLVIFLPLLFHAAYGVVIVARSGFNADRYAYVRNWRYVFQRITGIVALAFVAWHIYGTKLQVELAGVDPSYGMVHAIASDPVGLTLFATGLLCCVYHFINGLWTFLITWGVTVTERSQKISQCVLTAAFIVASAFSMQALLAFA